MKNVGKNPRGVGQVEPQSGGSTSRAEDDAAQNLRGSTKGAHARSGASAIEPTHDAKYVSPPSSASAVEIPKEQVGRPLPRVSKQRSQIDEVISKEEALALRNIYREVRGLISTDDLAKPVDQGGSLRAQSGQPASRTHVYRLTRTGDDVRVEVTEVTHTHPPRRSLLLDVTVPVEESPVEVEPGSEPFIHWLSKP